jgi:hypothetical protein
VKDAVDQVRVDPLNTVFFESKLLEVDSLMMGVKTCLRMLMVVITTSSTPS